MRDEKYSRPETQPSAYPTMLSVSCARHTAAAAAASQRQTENMPNSTRPSGRGASCHVAMPRRDNSGTASMTYWLAARLRFRCGG